MPEVHQWLPSFVIFGLLGGSTLAAQWATHWAERSGGESIEERIVSARAGKRRRRRPLPRAVAVAALGGIAASGIAVYFALAPLGVLLAPAAVPAALEQQPELAFITFVVAAALWWWGLRTGSESVGYDELVRNFLIGVAGLLCTIGVNAASSHLPRAELLGQLLVYLAVGLFLLALASIQATRRYERRQGEQDLALPSHWWGTVAGVVGGLLLTALLLSLIFAPETLAGLAGLVGTVLALIGQAVAVVIALVSYPIFLLLASLMSLITLRPLEGQLPELQMPQGPVNPLADAVAQTNGTPVEPSLLWTAAGIATLVAIFILFVLAIRRFRTGGDEEDVAETHESILSLDLLKAQLAELLRRGQRGAAEVAPYAPLTGDDAATRVRRIYQQFLQWAAAEGHTRLPGMTPDHYCEVLSAAYPAQQAHFAVITQTYRTARYGGSALTEADAVAAAAAWQHILAVKPEALAG
jgi:hypothetical protein